VHGCARPSRAGTVSACAGSATRVADPGKTSLTPARLRIEDMARITERSIGTTDHVMDDEIAAKVRDTVP
jgi:hypothetical protein